MACLPCIQNSMRLNSIVRGVSETPEECEYTVEFLTELLGKVETQLINNVQFIFFQSVVRSQINTYNTNCNLFKDYISTNIIPIVT